MKFYDYLHLYQYDNKRFCGDLKKDGINNIDEYVTVLGKIWEKKTGRKINKLNCTDDDFIRILLGSAESEWIKNERPYYDIYPSVINLLKNVNLNFEYDNLSMPMGLASLMLRFPENEIIRNIFFRISNKNGKHILLMNVLFRDETPISESMECDRVTVTASWEDGVEFSEVVDKLISESDSSIMHNSLVKESFAICISICMIGDDHEFLDAQLLNKDVDKVNDENRQHYIDKAKSHGKYGFSFGKRIEICPHLRREHMCMVPYGPNRSLRKYKLRKGSIVHRKAIETVPTGLLEEKK